MQQHLPILFENIHEEKLRFVNYFAVEIIEVIFQRDLFNFIAVGKLRVLI
jgi:hypothetical protein